MIYPGTDLKFRITAAIPGFDITEHNCSVEISTRRGRVQRVIPKSSMFHDDNGGWYFALENARTGEIFARFNAEVPDRDYNKQVRVITDFQLLCTVGPVCPCASSCQQTHDVQYEQVWTTNIDGETYLTDEQGNLILTEEGQRIRFTGTSEPSRSVTLDMSGNEFKELVEGRSDDGSINTVPEVLDVMQGLDEDTELTVMTDTDVDDMMDRILNN